MKTTEKFVVILAVYYPSYFKKAIHELTRIFGSSMTLIVVDNGNAVSGFGIEHLIKGSNIGGEFSAWDEGYQYVSENFKLDSQVLIFCNDTFCNHRYFTCIDRVLYKKRFSQLFGPEKTIVGEINSIKEEFVIHDEKIRYWLSSYIFAVNCNHLSPLIPFNKCEEYDRSLIAFNSDKTKKMISIGFFSVNLNKHLSSWLFPDKGCNGWYGASNSDDKKLEFKLKAIINEKLLSYNAVRFNFNVLDIYKTFPFKSYNSLRNKIYLKISRLKKAG